MIERGSDAGGAFHERGPKVAARFDHDPWAWTVSSKRRR